MDGMGESSLNRIIFVYNADSGLGNALIDGAHKIVSPSTYECSLCAITHGSFKEKGIWKKFRTESDLPMEFLHKDEFVARYRSKFGHKFTFPIVLAAMAGGLEVLIRTEELNAMGDATELMDLIKNRVN